MLGNSNHNYLYLKQYLTALPNPTLAQLVEHLTVAVIVSLIYRYQNVAGSIPAGRMSYIFHKYRNQILMNLNYIFIFCTCNIKIHE